MKVKEAREFYDEKLLELAKPYLIHSIFRRAEFHEPKPRVHGNLVDKPKRSHVIPKSIKELRLQEYNRKVAILHVFTRLKEQ